MVGFPIAAQRPVVEGIGIRVYQDTFSLSVDKSCHHQLQVLIFLHQRQIGPYLRWRVAQPHGIYITCNDESIWSAILHSISDSSVKRIGKQFSNIQRNFSSFILGFASSIAASTSKWSSFCLQKDATKHISGWKSRMKIIRGGLKVICSQGKPASLQKLASWHIVFHDWFLL